MRPFPALAAALALVVAASVARAVPSVPASRGTVLPSSGNGFRQSAAVRIAPAGGDDLAYTVDLDITYLSGIALPQVDAFPVGFGAPTDTEVRGDGGLGVKLLPPGPRTLVISLSTESAQPPHVAHIHFKQPFPSKRTYGWKVVRADVDWALGAFQVARDVRTTVVVPRGVELPGFDCEPGANGSACTRLTKHWIEPTTVAAAAPLDRLGLFLIAVAVGGSVFGFEQGRRKRALALEEQARARPVTPVEVPGGAYRAPPAKTMGATGDAAEEVRTLNHRTTVLALSALASTALVSLLASGHSPWPMAWVTAAWVAIVGFAGSLLVERF